MSLQSLMTWQQAKGQLIMAHEKWIDSILKSDVKKLNLVIKGYRYLDEGIRTCNRTRLGT